MKQGGHRWGIRLPVRVGAPGVSRETPGVEPVEDGMRSVSVAGVECGNGVIHCLVNVGQRDGRHSSLRQRRALCGRQLQRLASIILVLIDGGLFEVSPGTQRSRY